MANHGGDDADLLVIFGITGDLARRMTFRSLYRLERRELLDCPVIGVASAEISAGQLVKQAREAIVGSGEEFDDAVFDRLARRMSYLPGDVTDGALYRKLAAQMGGSQRPLFYLEVPPSLFGPIVEHLGSARLVRDGRVAVEKPFGHDLDSARELNARLHKVLRDDQILRVDHFLGMEPVIGLEYLRFANFALAELWDRKSVSCVQVTMAEDFGVGGPHQPRPGVVRPVRRRGSGRAGRAGDLAGRGPQDRQPGARRCVRQAGHHGGHLCCPAGAAVWLDGAHRPGQDRARRRRAAAPEGVGCGVPSADLARSPGSVMRAGPRAVLAGSPGGARRSAWVRPMRRPRVSSSKPGRFRDRNGRRRRMLRLSWRRHPDVRSGAAGSLQRWLSLAETTGRASASGRER
jgi:hypothetical protein